MPVLSRRAPSPQRRATPWGIGLCAAALAALAVLPPGEVARAEPTLWERATRSPEETARAERYQAEMSLAQGYAVAVMSDLDPDAKAATQRSHLINEAKQALRRAAMIRPDAAEPHYLLALLVYTTQLYCAMCAYQPDLAAEVVEALHAFEMRAPADPRLTRVLDERAILHTRLSGTGTAEEARAHVEQAIADYRTFIERNPSQVNWEVVYGNLAEALMMVGRIEESIATYRLSQTHGAGVSTVLGLAVALDRDERGTEARQLVRGLSEEALGSWLSSVAQGNTFYVPEGEIYYYQALVAEARGESQVAISAYRLFERSGAHPQYAARAAANRRALERTPRR